MSDGHIDFDAVVARFDEDIAAQTKLTLPLFHQLGSAVSKLDRASLAAERATRAYPVLRYRSDALTLTLDTRLMPMLPTQPSLGFVDGLADGGRRFIDELGFVRTAVEQEIALPRLLRPLVSMTEVVLASLQRFEAPSSAMFAPGSARFSDIFGVGNLVWSGLLGDENQRDILATASSVAGLLPERSSDAGSDAEPASDPIAAITALSSSIDDVAATVFDVVLLLPVASLALDIAIHDVTTVIKVEILTAVSDVERQVFEIRASVVDGLLDVIAYGSLAQAGLDVIESWANGVGSVLETAIPRWTSSLLSAIEAYLDGVTAAGRWVVSAVTTIQRAIDDVMGLDLIPIILNRILPSGIVDRLPALPSLTIGDLVDMAGGVGGGIRDEIDDWLETAEDILYWTPFARRYSYKIRDIRFVFTTVLTPTPFTYPPDALPTGTIAGFPDVYALTFGGGRRTALLNSVTQLGVGLRAGVGGMFVGGRQLAVGLSSVASRGLSQMAQTGTGAQLRTIGENSVSMADSVFGGERQRLQRRMGEPPALAAAFDGVMAGGGIAMAAALIPIYVGGMRRFWEQRNQAREHPTSAHILARNGRLALVRVPRVVVNAPQHEPETPLAEAVGSEFHRVIGEAYVDGRNRLAQLARPIDSSTARAEGRRDG